MHKILIPEPLAGHALDRLRERFDVVWAPHLYAEEEALQHAMRDSHAVVVRNQTQLTAGLIRSAPLLRVIGRCGVGLDNIDVEAASARGVVVCYAPRVNAGAVAEFTFALVLCLARKIVSADRGVKAGRWDRDGHVGVELRGRTLAILGLGSTGTRVAMRARAFGMNILAHHRSMDVSHLAVTEAGARLVSFGELVRSADFLTIHLPLTDETRGLIDDAVLRQMKPSAYLINVSRGGIVVENDLYHALRERRIAGAALDVRDREPPGPSPLHAVDNVLLTPHVAGFTHEAIERVAESVASDVVRVLGGGEAIHYANFPKWPGGEVR